ncbi:hypothetical protein SEPCBS57363_000143 [Sporothrix epigloea]|uniref:Uncharacterized protein n=1 Tax=Sporothrix epigloea TaxID=1892477 RepID=A0ABP0D4K0_9PEZI
MAAIVQRRWREAGKPNDGAGRGSSARESEPASAVVTSSFFFIPTVVFTGVGFFPPWSGKAGRRNYDRIWPRRSRQHDAADLLVQALLTPTDEHDEGDECLLGHARAVLQASVFRHGTAAAIPYFAVAVVLNHARRTLWFGSAAVGFFARPQPLDDWRLLLARPDVFLEEMVRMVGKRSFIMSLLQKTAWDLVAGGLAATFLLSGHIPRSRLRRTLSCRAKDVAATVFLVWLASCIEYAVAQASTTLALGTALGLMAASPSTSGLLVRELKSGMAVQSLGFLSFLGILGSLGIQLLFVWRQMVVFPWTGLVPMIAQSARRPLDQPGVLLSLLVAVLAMDTLLRYRSRLYILIEMSGFFLFLGYGTLSAMVIEADRRMTKRGFMACSK